MVVRCPSGVMGRPKELSDFIEIEYKEINIFLRNDILHWINKNKLEILLEGYGKYIIEFQE